MPGVLKDVENLSLNCSFYSSKTFLSGIFLRGSLLDSCTFSV